MPNPPELNYTIKLSIAALIMIVMGVFSASSIYYKFTAMEIEVQTNEARANKRYSRTVEQMTIMKDMHRKEIQALKDEIMVLKMPDSDHKVEE